MQANRKKLTIRKHLPCPVCEYDLFGQIEVLRCVQCPECGEHIDLDTVLKDLRHKKLRGASIQIGSCLAAFSLVMGAGAWCALHFGPWQAALAAFAGMIWVALVWLCARRYRTVSYSRRVLFMFHLSFAAATVGVAMIAWAVYISARVPARFVIALMALSIPLFLLANALYWRAGGLLHDGHDLWVHEIPERTGPHA